MKGTSATISDFGTHSITVDLKALTGDQESAAALFEYEHVKQD